MDDVNDDVKAALRSFQETVHPMITGLYRMGATAEQVGRAIANTENEAWLAWQFTEGMTVAQPEQPSPSADVRRFPQPPRDLVRPLPMPDRDATQAMPDEDTQAIPVLEDSNMVVKWSNRWMLRPARVIGGQKSSF